MEKLEEQRILATAGRYWGNKKEGNKPLLFTNGRKPGEPLQAKPVHAVTRPDRKELWSGTRSLVSFLLAVCSFPLSSLLQSIVQVSSLSIHLLAYTPTIFAFV